MSQELSGRVALITGGTSGIGRAAAVAFARAGAKVMIGGRRQEEGGETVRLVRESGGEAGFLRTDVRREEDIAALVKATLDQFGRLDMAFNNAGIEGEGSTRIPDVTIAKYQEIFDVNVRGVLLSMKHEIPAMLPHGGAIVNNASVAATVGIPGAAVYVASKHAVVGLTRSAALEWVKQGIRVNCISPGGIATAMLARMMGGDDSEIRKKMIARLPIGRLGESEEVAEVVVWLCSPAASYVVGHDLVIDGGFVIK